MFSIPNLLTPVLGYVPAWLLLLALLAVSLVLIFAGRTLAKVVAFLVVGFAGAAIGGTLAAQFPSAGWSLLGIILGFVIGGMLGVALISVGIGLAVGYAAYLLALDFALGATIALVAGIAFFIVGLALSSRILAIVTALAGGLLLFHVLTYFGLGMMAFLIAAVLTLAGLWVQLVPSRRITPPTAAKAGGQQHDHG